MPEINNSFYDDLGESWYKAQDTPIAILRAQSHLLSAWVISHLKENQKVLDVACGGGFLSNRLALAGHSVIGIDQSIESLEVARRFDESRTVEYLEADAYKLPFPDQSFDVVTALDFLEHVEFPEKVIAEVSRVLKPNGLFFFHTFNRTWPAWLIVIKLLEWIVKNTPENLHVLSMFIKPKELVSYCKKNTLEVIELKGTRPILKSITFSSLFSGVVPVGLKFTFSSSLLMGYVGIARQK